MNGEIMSFLDRYTKSGAPVKGLGRFEALMHKLGDPQDSLKCVHIAGTNGKGSVTRMLAQSLALAGYKTGEFTSPFIYRYNDRIKINGREIPDGELSRIIGKIKPVLEGDDTGYSQFEITNAVAFIYFAEQKCDVAVLETGLGGLFDSTNIIRSNVCSVITSVSFDHTAVLGNTIEEIAYQKAGIIKDKCPVIVYPDNPPEAMDVIGKYADSRGSEMHVPDMNNIAARKVTPNGCEFIYRGEKFTTAMAGAHQIYNAVTAAEAAGVIAKKYPALTADIVREGIASAVMPSRCQIIRKSSPMVIVDGAHNPDGMKALSEFIKTLPHSPKIMICGMSADKDRERAVLQIAPYIDKAFCVDGFTNNAVPATELAKLFADGEAMPLSEAYRMAYGCAGDRGLLLIGGSLYLASALDRYIDPDKA